MTTLNERQVARNIAIHDRIARRYEKIHGEIFNPVEQARLTKALARARDAIETKEGPRRALDFGCGSGNLTRRLLDLGFGVTAADVSPGCLQFVERRFGGQLLSTKRMNGRDLSEIDDASFDLVATYSVLHHVPDYLAAVDELARVCKLGGVVFIDHEPSEDFWQGRPLYAEFRKAAQRFDWRKYLTPSNYIHRVRRVFDPRHSNEGDIHVWPDDHVEWVKIKSIMAQRGFEIIEEENYLLYRRIYRREVYDRYADICSDTKVMIFRKRG